MVSMSLFGIHRRFRLTEYTPYRLMRVGSLYSRQALLWATLTLGPAHAAVAELGFRSILHQVFECNQWLRWVLTLSLFPCCRR